MAVAFTRLSYWIWGGKDHETPNAALNSSSDFPSGYREPDSLKFPLTNGPRIRPSRIKRKWQSREERRRIDREYDIVLVPSDGGCMSGSESEDSDWSVGWLEPHGSDFDSDTESSFAVLVPCYGRGRCENVEVAKNGVLGAVRQQNLFFSVFFDSDSYFRADPTLMEEGLHNDDDDDGDGAEMTRITLNIGDLLRTCDAYPNWFH